MEDDTDGTAFDDSLFSSLSGAYGKDETSSLGLGKLDIGPAPDRTSTSQHGRLMFEVEDNLETLINGLEIQCDGIIFLINLPCFSGYPLNRHI